MNGHTSNRILRAHFSAAYAYARWERDREDHRTDELVAYWEGHMRAAVQSAIVLRLISGEQDFKDEQ